MTFQTSNMVDNDTFSGRILFEDQIVDMTVLGHQVNVILFFIFTSSSWPYPGGPKRIERRRRIVFWWILPLNNQLGCDD
jgi:hypothetical protein